MKISEEVRVVGSGVVIASQPKSAHSSLAFPGFCVLPSGRWLAGCRAGFSKIGTSGQHVVLSHSDDQGATWSEPRSPFTSPDVEGKPGLFRGIYVTSLGADEVLAVLMWTDHSDPDADFFNEETEGLLDTRVFLSRSMDDGLTWSVPRLVDTSPFQCPTPITGPVLRAPGNEWVLQFETNKPYYDTSEWRHSSVLMFSRDEGESWPEHSVASQVGDERIFYWDQRPAILRDGRILNLFWTYDNNNGQYLPNHSRESTDCGRTWSPSKAIGVCGQPSPPVELADGRLVMVYMDRECAPVIKLRISPDGGTSWPESTEATLFEMPLETQSRTKGSMQDAWAEMGKFSLGMPQPVLLPGGDMLIVFYHGLHADQTDLRWLRFRVG